MNRLRVPRDVLHVLLRCAKPRRLSISPPFHTAKPALALFGPVKLSNERGKNVASPRMVHSGDLGEENGAACSDAGGYCDSLCTHAPFAQDSSKR